MEARSYAGYCIAVSTWVSHCYFSFLFDLSKITLLNSVTPLISSSSSVELPFSYSFKHKLSYVHTSLYSPSSLVISLQYTFTFPLFTLIQLAFLFMWKLWLINNLLTCFLSPRLFPSLVGITAKHATAFGSKISKQLLPKNWSLNSYFQEYNGLFPAYMHTTLFPTTTPNNLLF